MGMRWQPNVGRFDQILRIGIGLVLMWVGFIDESLIGDRLVATLIGIFGLLNLIAAIVRVCPVYTVAGINTDKQDD
jgi:hypothetical protein